jgi:glutamate synthase (NADPH/NADH) small chain
MPARAEEIRHARDEGIIFQILTNPTRILGDENGWVRGIEYLRMELGTPDESGRKSPVPVKGSEFISEADTVIVAIGQSPNPMVIKSTPELKISPWGGIKADAETGATSMQGVFAGGDNVSGAATVILAMGAGKAAAESIGQYLRGLSAKR